MDGSSGMIHGYAASCIPAAFEYYREPEQLQQQQQNDHDELLVSSEIQQHLNQISRDMNMDYGSVVDDLDFLATNSFHATAGFSFASSSCTSSSLRSASLSCSPEITGLHFPEVSSFVAPGVAVLLPYDDQYVANFHDTPAATAVTSAFRHYERHLGPERRLTKPACGQRMFKTAMSVLGNMHTAMRYSHQQQQERYYQQQQQEASVAEQLGNQVQNMISERKRREKLKDSFRALKTVLPPGSKKKLDKTSILIITREYVNSLKSKICELEEKNQALQSQLATSPEEDGAGETVEIQITRAVAVEVHQTGEVCTVKIAMPALGGNTTDMVLRILQRLKDQIGEDVSLVSMSTGEDGDGPRSASMTLHLHLKSASGAKWEEEAVREAVTKAMTSPAQAERQLARHPTH